MLHFYIKEKNSSPKFLLCFCHLFYDKKQFPTFPLEDKGKPWAVGLDKPPVHITYVSRGKKQGQRVLFDE